MGVDTEQSSDHLNQTGTPEPADNKPSEQAQGEIADPSRKQAGDEPSETPVVSE